MEKNNKWMVCVQCMTYNQAPFIDDAMNGFVSQETTFPYICCIVDDSSTDGEPEVIDKYMIEHFDLDDASTVRREETDDYSLLFARHKINSNCYFALFFLKYNHYSTPENKLKKLNYISKWIDNAKYIALCEGDDYWTSPHVLQQKVNIMESDEHISMICNKTDLFSNRQQKIIGCKPHADKNSFIPTKELILGGGGYIATCSFFFRTSVRDAYPVYCRKCHVGDYPLQIMCSMKGRVLFLSETMSVYRIENSGSWVGKWLNTGMSYKRIQGMKSEIMMLKGFSHDYPDYSKYFEKRGKIFIIVNVPKKKKDASGYTMYCEEFHDVIKTFNIVERLSFKLYSTFDRKYLHVESIYRGVKNRMFKMLTLTKQ